VKSPISPPTGGFAEYAQELLAPVGRFVARRMFGGQGFFMDGLMFSFVSRDVLYLKVDDETRARFEQAGSQPFVYEAKNRKQVSLNYCSMPEEGMESPALALPWARMAIEAALRKANSKPLKAKRTAKPRTTSKTKAPSEPTGAKRRASSTHRSKAAQSSNSKVLSSPSAKVASKTAKKSLRARSVKSTKLKKTAKLPKQAAK